MEFNPVKSTLQTNSEKSPLTTKVEKLSEKDISLTDRKILVGQINKLLKLQIDNEIMFTEMVRDGAVYKNSEGEEKISDVAIAMHQRRKDSLSDLIKIRELLEGRVAEVGLVALIVKTPGEKDELKEIIRRLEDLNKKLEMDGDDNILEGGFAGNRLN